MDESLTERRYVVDEALRGVNTFYLGGSRKALREEPRSYQLVGGVMAHQGYDG